MPDCFIQVRASVSHSGPQDRIKLSSNYHQNVPIPLALETHVATKENPHHKIAISKLQTFTYIYYQHTYITPFAFPEHLPHTATWFARAYATSLANTLESQKLVSNEASVYYGIQ